MPDAGLMMPVSIRCAPFILRELVRGGMGSITSTVGPIGITAFTGRHTGLHR